jgi:drug/metabolite transporter (DMT)-like permease
MTGERESWKLPVALAAIYLIWGSTYLAIRVMVDSIPPLLGAGVRFALAGAIFYLVVVLCSGAAAIRVRPVELAGAAATGTLLMFGGNGLVTIAEQDVPSGLAALIIGAVPLWVVVFRLLARERVAPVTIAGVLLGFAGLALLVLPGDRPGDAPLWGVLVLVAASISWASGSFYSRTWPLPRDLVVSVATQMLAGGVLMILVGLAAGEGGRVDLAHVSLDSALAFAYLVAIGSLVAFTAYGWLLKNARISTVATYAFVNPVVAVFLGWAILSEEVTSAVIAGTLAIVASVAFVVRRENGAAQERAPRAHARRASRFGRRLPGLVR